MAEILPKRRITLSNKSINSKSVNDSCIEKINETNRTYDFNIVCLAVLYSRSSRNFINLFWEVMLQILKCLKPYLY